MPNHWRTLAGTGTWPWAVTFERGSGLPSIHHRNEPERVGRLSPGSSSSTRRNPAKRAAGKDGGRRVVVEHDLAVDPHRAHADRQILRVAEIRAVGDLREVEEHEIGEVVRRNQAAPDEAGVGGGEAGHLADGFLDREQPLV